MRGMGQWASGPESWGLSRDPPRKKKKSKIWPKKILYISIKNSEIKKIRRSAWKSILSPRSSSVSHLSNLLGSACSVQKPLWCWHISQQSLLIPTTKIQWELALAHWKKRPSWICQQAFLAHLCYPWWTRMFPNWRCLFTGWCVVVTPHLITSDNFVDKLVLLFPILYEILGTLFTARDKLILF